MKKIVYYFWALLLIFGLTSAVSSLAQTEKTISFDTFKASDLLGVQLHTPEMDVMGQISDVVIDPGTKRIVRIVVSDVPGLGRESVALPFDFLVKVGNSLFTYSVPGKEPYFYGDKLLWPVGFYWVADLDYVLSYVQPIPTETRQSSQLMGAQVETQNGEEVAWINDLVVDSQNGHVVFLVLSDVAGMEDKMVAVPFDTLSEPRGNVFVLNATKDKLLAAPDFKWQDTTNPKYAEAVYRYYGLQPYWESE